MLQTRVIENAKICDFSFVDFGFDQTYDSIMDGLMCYYSPYYEEDYVDGYWGVDIGTEYLNLGTTSWYGTQQLWTSTI